MNKKSFIDIKKTTEINFIIQKISNNNYVKEQIR